MKPRDLLVRELAARHGVGWRRVKLRTFRETHLRDVDGVLLRPIVYLEWRAPGRAWLCVPVLASTRREVFALALDFYRGARK